MTWLEALTTYGLLLIASLAWQIVVITLCLIVKIRTIGARHEHHS